MSQISVLIVVDVEGALAGSLQENVYLVDTHKHVGSGREGQAELQTACHDGDIINWAVVPVAPTSDVEIHGFTGKMIDDGVCVPQPVQSPAGNYWQGRVEARGTTGNQQYSVVLTMAGRQMTFDPFLAIS